MRRRREAADLANHPFRSLFDLMLALVLILLAAFVLRKPGVNSKYDVTHRREEMLLLHNLRIRKERGEAAPLLTSLRQAEPGDICRDLVQIHDRPLSDLEKQALEAHRNELWQEVAPTVRARLLSPRISRTIAKQSS